MKDFLFLICFFSHSYRIPWPTTETDCIYLWPHTQKSFLEAFFINKEESTYFDFEVDEEFDFWFVIKQL